jgi:hypothetical protein
MIDTLNYWRESLDSLGRSVGVAKLPFPSDTATADEWDTYCRRDVEVIRAAMHAWWTFLAAHDLGGAARTLAGQALRTYRHRFMPVEIFIDSDDAGLRLARASYHGGRTEAFYLGRARGRVTALDINSMYPYVMSAELFPARSLSRCRSVSLAELRRWVSRYCVVADVTIAPKEPRYAHHTRDGLIFPVGRFREHLTTPDLQTALEHDEIASIHEVVLYEPAHLFRQFISELYALRLAARAAGDVTQTYLLKILMNSLYGKFGQRGETWETIGETDTDTVGTWLEYDYESGVVHRLRSFAGVIQESRKLPESYHSSPAIAAHVTAYARRLLWSLIERAGRRDCYYCDTDSLYVSDRGRDRLADDINPTELGALKVEGETDRLVIHGAKDYEFGDKRVCKGVRSKAQWLTDDSVSQEQWSSLRGLIRAGDISAPQTRTVTKTLHRHYRKGRVTSSGWIAPWVLTE